VPNNRRGFSGLLEPPKPLPEEESSTPKPAVELHAVPTEEVQAVKKAAKKAPAGKPVRGQLPEPVPQVKSPAAVLPKASEDEQTGGRRAATSIRIQQSVADDLEAAWLRAKSVDLRLSYSEYASRLLRRALQEENQGV
jgi:hypothetical protein